MLLHNGLHHLKALAAALPTRQCNRDPVLSSGQILRKVVALELVILIGISRAIQMTRALIRLVIILDKMAITDGSVMTGLAI
jgi:hypothetical protein